MGFREFLLPIAGDFGWSVANSKDAFWGVVDLKGGFVLRKQRFWLHVGDFLTCLGSGWERPCASVCTLGVNQLSAGSYEDYGIAQNQPISHSALQPYSQALPSSRFSCLVSLFDWLRGALGSDFRGLLQHNCLRANG